MRHMTAWVTLLSVGLGLPVCAAEIGSVTFDPPDGEFVVGSRHDFRMTVQATGPLQAGAKIRVIVPIGGWSRPSLDPEREGQSGPGGGMVHVTVTPIGGRRFRVTSEPDRAGLWVDNRRVGNTPTEVGPLSPGGHDFRAAKRGRATWTARLRVSRDGKSIKNVTGFQFSKVAHRMARQSDEKLKLLASPSPSVSPRETSAGTERTVSAAKSMSSALTRRLPRLRSSPSSRTTAG